MATVAARRASATSSRAMRVFPIPAGPTIVQSLQVRRSRDSAKASRSAFSSRSRPTNGVVSRGTAGAGSASSNSLHACTGAERPLTSSGSSASARTLPSTSL